MPTVTLTDICLPQRPADGHKGTFGKVLLVGGSPGMSGSIGLSGMAALRGGAGLVTVAVPASIQAVVAGYEPSYMTAALPCAAHGQLGDQPMEDVRELVAGRSAVGIGPGLGQSNAAADLVLSVLKESECPVLLDADALNLATEYELLKSRRADQACLLTPHPGEFSRLTGLSPSEINSRRVEVATEFANQHGVIVVLKGAGTVVTDGRQVYVNSSGNSGMGTGGCGDVLTGLLTALLGQSVPCFDAAVLGVYLHGLAGDLAAEEMSQPGMIASDLLRCLGKAWLRFQQNPFR